MDKFYRWSAKHRWYITIAYNIIFWIPIIISLLLGALFDFSFYVVYFLLIFPTSLIFLIYFPKKAIDKAIKKLDANCDPYPLLETVNEQLTYVRLKSFVTVLQQYKGIALALTGQYAEALEIACKNNLEAKRTPIPTQIAYCIDLAALYTETGDYSSAALCFNKADQLLSLKLSPHVKSSCLIVYNLNFATYKIYTQQIGEASVLVDSINDSNFGVRSLVDLNLLKSRLLIAQNKPQEALPALRYVINNGNRLYAVTEARELLAGIEGVQQND
ncbi:MAG: hypothetical protein LBS74_04725 [Oscillospiraceae bacterium]|jgi:tetratricopeptide (TPR) repeat protein|nr:hypothetical protein [Oscillospiraceae bacterium]